MRPEVEAKLLELLPQARSEAWKIFQGAPHQLDREELQSLAYLGLVMAAARWEDYCVSPDTPVLTAGLDWVPAGSLVAGDELVTVDEEIAARESRRYRRGVVLATPRRETQGVRLTLEDGRQVTSSADHRWLVYGLHGGAEHTLAGKSSAYRWRQARDIRPGAEIASPLRTWPRESSFDAGWLAGMFDGEGWLARHNASSTTIGLAQNEGPVLDRVVQLLTDMDVPFRLSKAGPERSCRRVTIGARWAAIEVIGRLQPTRLSSRSRQLWEDWRIVKARSGANRVRVAAAEFVGRIEVVSLETSTRTFLANGLVAHNCAEHGYSPDAMEYFAAYALRRLRGSMLDALRSQDWVTRSVRGRAKLMRAAGQDLGASEAQIEEETGLTPQQQRDTLAQVARRPVSMDAEPVEVAEAASVAGQQVVHSVLVAVAEAMDALSADGQAVMALRFHEGRELREISVILDLPPDTVADLHNQGVLAVHDVMMRVVGE